MASMANKIDGVEFPRPDDLRWRVTRGGDAYALCDLYVESISHGNRVEVRDVNFGTSEEAHAYFEAIQYCFRERDRVEKERKKRGAQEYVAQLVSNPRLETK